jgi:myo-inositol-1(or 4)-monophosphatase
MEQRVTDETYLNFMLRLAAQAGRLMLDHINTGVVIELKSDKTAVTAMDRAVHDLVMGEIAEHYPNDTVDGEEGQRAGESKFVFSIDETDGTVPAAVGMAHFVFSAALLERNKDGTLTPRSAVVNNPTQERMYWATRGGGAYCNDTRLHVNDRNIGPGTYVDVEWWPQAPASMESMPDAAKRLALETGTYCLTPGSAINGAMLVASGGFTGLVFAGGSPDKVPDITASSLIVTEAGGTVTDLHGQPLDFADFRHGALMTNTTAHVPLLEYFKLGETAPRT